MLEGFWDWLNHWQSIALLFLVIVLPCSLFVIILDSAEKKALDFQHLQEKLMLTLTFPYIDEDIVYPPVTYCVVNNWNFTVQLNMHLYSEPPDIMGFLDFSSSFENGETLQANETLTFEINIATYSNLKNITGDYYLKIYGEPT